MCLLKPTSAHFVSNSGAEACPLRVKLENTTLVCNFISFDNHFEIHRYSLKVNTGKCFFRLSGKPKKSKLPPWPLDMMADHGDTFQSMSLKHDHCKV